ncbi:MAG: hypothetical protein RLZ55_1620 [Actinomycetota bacterium]
MSVRLFSPPTRVESTGPTRADLLSSLVSFTVEADPAGSSALEPVQVPAVEHPDFDRPDIDVAAESAEQRLVRFERVVDTYMPVLYGNALRLTGNTEDAADLVQVTFERAFKAFDKYQPGTNLKAWLFRIQTNAHINDYRKAQRMPRLSDADTVEDWQMARAETHTARGLRSTETEVLEGMPEQVVTEALASLSPDYRQAVLLADVEGMRYKEIAEIMGTPVGTVMSRLHRGRKLLRENLMDHAREVGYLRDEPVPAVAVADPASTMETEGGQR